MKRIKILPILLLAFVAFMAWHHFYVYIPKWSVIVDTSDGSYGFVDFARRTKTGFKTCEEAKAASDADRAWSDNWDAERRKARAWFRYKKVECDK